MNKNEDKKKSKNSKEYMDFLYEKDVIWAERNALIKKAKTEFQKKLDILTTHYRIKTRSSIAKNVRKFK